MRNTIFFLVTLASLAACGVVTPDDLIDLSLSDTKAATDPIDESTGDESTSGSTGEQSTGDTGPTTGGEPACEVMLIFVSPDETNERPWIRVLHSCTPNEIGVEAFKWRLVDLISNSESNHGLIPPADDLYPVPLTESCAIIMWSAYSKAATFGLKRDQTGVLTGDEVDGYFPGMHQGALRTTDPKVPWVAVPEDMIGKPTCEGYN